MTRIHLIIGILLVWISALSANGVGSTMDEVLKDDFATFFNIQQQEKKELTLGQTKMHYKTGGFQEHIDLYFTKNKDNQLIAAEIEIDYSFIKEKGMLAIDVIKSFIKDFCHEKDASVCNTLAMRLFNREGEVAKELAGAMRVLEMKKKFDVTTLQSCVLNTEARKNKLVFQYYFINWKELTIGEEHFLDEKIMQSYKMTLVQEEPTFHVWQNKNDKEMKVPFERLVDGRWQFETEEEALNYFNAYQLQQSEGMLLIEIYDNVIADKCNVYQSTARQQDMLETLGIKDKYYTFLSRKGKSIAKIFVCVKPDGTKEEATKLVEKAISLL